MIRNGDTSKLNKIIRNAMQPKGAVSPKEPLTLSHADALFILQNEVADHFEPIFVTIDPIVTNEKHFKKLMHTHAFEETELHIKETGAHHRESEPESGWRIKFNKKQVINAAIDGKMLDILARFGQKISISRMKDLQDRIGFNPDYLRGCKYCTNPNAPVTDDLELDVQALKIDIKNRNDHLSEFLEKHARKGKNK